MTVVSKCIGLGTAVGVRASGSTAAFTTVAGLIGISGPNPSADSIDVSTIDNATNFKEEQGGQVDPGDVTMNLAYGSTNPSQKILAGFLASRAAAEFQITFPTTTTAAETFTGYVNGMGREIQKDAMTTRSVTVGVTGDPGWPKTT